MDQVRSSSSSSNCETKNENQDDDYVEPIDVLTSTNLVRESEFSFSLESIIRNKHNFCCEYYCCVLERPKIFIDYTTFANEDENDNDNGKILFV